MFLIRSEPHYDLFSGEAAETISHWQQVFFGFCTTKLWMVSKKTFPRSSLGKNLTKLNIQTVLTGTKKGQRSVQCDFFN